METNNSLVNNDKSYYQTRLDIIVEDIVDQIRRGTVKYTLSAENKNILDILREEPYVIKYKDIHGPILDNYEDREKGFMIYKNYINNEGKNQTIAINVKALDDPKRGDSYAPSWFLVDDVRPLDNAPKEEWDKFLDNVRKAGKSVVKLQAYVDTSEYPLDSNTKFSNVNYDES